MDGNGGIRARAVSLPNHKMFSPKDSGVGTDTYAKVKSSGIDTITDDSVATVLVGVNTEGATLHVAIWGELGGKWASAAIACSTHATQHGGTVMSQGGSYFFDAVTTAVTGTDGIDGFFTVSFTNGGITFENRIGDSARVKYWLLY